MRRILAVLIALSFLFVASSAWAIDGYKDRHGFFVGGGLGGGPGAVHITDDTTFESGLSAGELGLAPHFIVGGGATDRLVFGAEANSWIRTVSRHGNRLNHQHWSFNAVSNFFIIHGFYLEAGLGLGYAISDATTNQGEERNYREMGLAGKAGLGFEYFLDGTIAAGMSFGYTRHFYSNVDFDTFTGTVTLRWY